MTLDATVRVKYGRFNGKIGTVVAICDKSEYLVDFGGDGERGEPIKGYWISGIRLEQI